MLLGRGKWWGGSFWDAGNILYSTLRPGWCLRGCSLYSNSFKYVCFVYFYIGIAFHNEKIEKNEVSWQHLSRGYLHKNPDWQPPLKNWQIWPVFLVANHQLELSNSHFLQPNLCSLTARALSLRFMIHATRLVEDSPNPIPQVAPQHSFRTQAHPRICTREWWRVWAGVWLAGAGEFNLRFLTD